MLCWGAVKWVPETTAYDEAFDRSAAPRSHYRPLVSTLESFTLTEIARRERLQKISLVDQGITFTVYGEKDGLERIFPFDFVPRIIPAREWERIEAGLIQRVTALNLFISDVYQDQKCLKDKIIPAELVLSRKEYKRELLRVTPPRQIYTHVVGTDIIRNDRGEYLILEDNCRCPSGVSYVLENRNLLHRVFPEFFTRYPVRPVREYPRLLLDTLLWAAPRASENPVAVVLTPGIHNSAYFEHSFLAREMGALLVEGRDLIVEDSYVYMRTTGGRQRVDVIYRRVDEDFLDPLTFRRDSMLGVPGLVNVYREGNVAIANAPGAGVADDKAVYAFVPDIIRYYLGEDAILPNIETFLCREPAQLTHVLANLDKLVVKAVGASGGYGMLVGPHSTKAQQAEFADALRADPANYIAQPTIQLSTAPCLIDGAVEPRHVDLRPFILSGDKIVVTPGALTRVALRKGSLVVNSSQGGGSKDTWVLSEPRSDAR